MEYGDFLRAKTAATPSCGLSIEPRRDGLFPFQAALTSWAVRRGRCALFAGTGLGKTRMQVRWSEAVRAATGSSGLILAPLSVAEQTAREAAGLGVDVRRVRSGEECGDGIFVTNIDRLHLFDPDDFGFVVVDESSIIKHYTSRTLSDLIDACSRTPYRLCCTATPAPNDWTELGTHAEFLGICTRTEMLSEFFCHDGGETQTWRLKGHARAAFWRWVASWGAMLRHPRDLGMDQPGYDLPPLSLTEHIVRGEAPSGLLFASDDMTLMERRSARKASLPQRVEECVALVNADEERWVVWCDLNTESEALSAAIRGAVEVTGSMDVDTKEAAMRSFLDGSARVLVSKPSICGFGVNLQFCSHVAFVGVTDSWESYHQAVRRCWRFGQPRTVEVHLFASDAEGSVLANLARKEADAATMAEELAKEVGPAIRSEVLGHSRFTLDYQPDTEMEIPAWVS